MITYILICVLSVVYIYYKIFGSKHYWEIRNVTCTKPWPIVGNMGKVCLKNKSFAEKVLDLYNEYPNERYNGFYQFSRPVFLVRDVDLIKQMSVKDFDHFTDHYVLLGNKNDSPMTKNLFALKGREWKEMRSTLSPAFTSSKMKGMFNFMSECAENLTKYYLKKNENVIIEDMKEVASRFANDIIASTAFGIKCDSFNDPKNDFYLMGQSLTNLSPLRTLAAFLMQLFPNFCELVGITFFSKTQVNFFREIVLDNMRKREKEGIIRPDLIHLLMEAKTGKLNHENNPQEEEDTGFATVKESRIYDQYHKKLTDDDIVAQALVFFFAGFDTISTASSFTCLELASNPDIQTKLQNEIDLVLNNCKNGTIDYQTLMQMKYLDQVISESLRLWPPGFQTDRLCVKDFIIKPTNPKEKSVLIENGMDCVFPLIGLHRDPKYFPNPLQFDPDRFSDENKPNITPGTYYPFGLGPRNCIGSRFALLEMKIFFFYLLSKFDLVPVEKTKIPIKLNPAKINLAAEGGFILGLKPRKNVNSFTT